VIKKISGFVVILNQEKGNNRAGDQNLEFISSGRCMSPLFLPGDKLKLEPVGNRRIKKGWVVVYNSNGKYFAHRVTRVRSKFFWARGDNTLREDGPLCPKSLVGRVVSVERDGVQTQPWGLAHPRLGLVRADLVKAMHLARIHLPRLDRLAEKHVFRRRFFLMPFGCIAGCWLGEMNVEIDESKERMLGEMLSHGISSNEVITTDLERSIKEREASLLVMRDRKGRKVGMLVLYQPGEDSQGDCALVFSIWLPFWLRGIGLGSELLEAAIAESRRRGYEKIGAAVPPDKGSFLGLFYKVGFRKVSNQKFVKRDAFWDRKEFEGKLWLERAL
jgi:L-amino acid N-acyltransferase YncA